MLFSTKFQLDNSSLCSVQNFCHKNTQSYIGACIMSDYYASISLKVTKYSAPHPGNLYDRWRRERKERKGRRNLSS